MKRKVLLIVSLVALLACMLALAVNAACTECTENWTLTVGDEGYLGKITAVNTCSVCKTQLETEIIDPLFLTLGYSYSEMGGITQHYAVNREALKRYEELAQEKVRFGAVAATRNHVSGDPLDENGNPVSNRVKSADFTDTEYDIFDIIVNGIGEEYRDSTEIICCAYIIAGGKVTYIDNGVEKVNAAANTHKSVAQKVDNKELDTPALDSLKIINGVKYRVVSLADMELSKWSFWQSDGSDYRNIQSGTGSTNKKFFATRKFNKSELPNGTIILVDTDWQYRPEAWVTESTKNNSENSSSTPKRPKTTGDSVVVDDQWWGDFTIRAFNITPGSAIADSTTAEDIYKIFQIYVPLNAEGSTENEFIPPLGEVEVPFDPTEDLTKQNWDADGALKILTIGNSFSDDSMEYVYQVAEAAGVDEIVLGNLYIGGCSLATHLSNATNDNASYTYRKNTSGTWSSTGSYRISTAVQSDDWDFISFQQVSGYSGIADSYDDLAALIEIVEPLNPSARLVWHMTWAYQSGSSHADFPKYNKDQMTMYNAIVNAVQTKILTNDKIEIVIPAGTAIQNTRTSYIGDTLTRDGYHLSKDLGRFIGSLSFVKALTGLPIDDITYTPDGVDENELLVAVESVNNAALKPYEVTNSAYTSEPESGDTGDTTGGVITGYTVLTFDQMGITYASYYNSQQTGNNIQTKPSDGFAMGFIATKIFTKEELPVGTIIEIADGYQYRPEGWSWTGTRPGNVSTTKIVVDESWWGNYTTRAFNISSVSHTTSNYVKIDHYTQEQVCEIFKISVPIVEENDSTLVSSELCVQEITEIDGVQYRALTMEAMGLQLEEYYYSTHSTSLWQDGTGTEKKFAATRLFERTELVDGMLIWVASGWQYRPEGWVGTTLNDASERPGNYSTQAIVNSTWWGFFTTRGFNISLTSGGELIANGYDTIEEIYAAFKIYVPVSKIAEAE